MYKLKQTNITECGLYLYLKFSVLEPTDKIYIQKANNMNHTYKLTYKQEIGQPVPTSGH